MPMSQSAAMLNPPTSNVALRKEPGWWALYVRHQHEKTVVEVLSARGLETFLPLYQSVSRWKDRDKVLSLPLFPGYVFVRGGLEWRLQVVTTPGVHMILSRGGQFATVPEAEIHAIRLAMGRPDRVEPHPFLECGQRVRVKQGPLEGVEGILVRKKNLWRLVLSVDMLGQSAAIDIDAAAVEPCDTAISGNCTSTPGRSPAALVPQVSLRPQTSMASHP